MKLFLSLTVILFMSIFLSCSSFKNIEQNEDNEWQPEHEIADSEFLTIEFKRGEKFHEKLGTVNMEAVVINNSSVSFSHGVGFELLFFKDNKWIPLKLLPEKSFIVEMSYRLPPFSESRTFKIIFDNYEWEFEEGKYAMAVNISAVNVPFKALHSHYVPLTVLSEFEIE